MPKLPLLLVFHALLTPLPAVAADGWAFRTEGGAKAGYVADGGWAGLWFACTPEGRRLFVSAGKTPRQTGIERTVILDVDGTAFLQRMRTDSGSSTLSRPLTAAEAGALGAALAKGKRAEIAMPAGRFVLPLNGSGKAMAAFAAACG
ncbi:hypothetical protein [Aureimonas psammosilenae]|uniref:hypothetical protein n=1 Tax=Aureimonas psammosilenae TaxID=2495496 RepID=UPI00126076F1|nr:hypothetical protein [Aureimonas psammosilenae]